MERPPPSGGGEAADDSNTSLGDPSALNTRDLSTPQSITRTDPTAAAQLSTAYHTQPERSLAPSAAPVIDSRAGARGRCIRIAIGAAQHRSNVDSPVANFRGLLILLLVYRMIDSNVR